MTRNITAIVIAIVNGGRSHDRGYVATSQRSWCAWPTDCPTNQR